jgi:hypothetical protein
MEKVEILEKIERRIQDLNYMINSDKKDAKMQFAWEYAREELKIVIQMLKG